MTMLDYATVYETQFRRRRLRRALFGVLAVIVSATPVVAVGLSQLG
jgi:hypothetical protein